MMRITDVEVISAADYCQLQGWVESDADPDDADWFEPFSLWHRFPPWCRPFLSPINGDPFLAALLVPAMQTGERLALSAPVSPMLLEALPDLQAIYAAFDPTNKPVAVTAEARDAPLPTDGIEPRVGLFFSMGIDSTYSLLKNERNHPDDQKSVTDLISLHGFDACFGEWDSRFPAALLSNFERVAAEKGKTLLPVVTNVRRVTGPLAPWTMVHGAALFSTALALGAAFRRVLIAASATYDKAAPWGTHPVLDPRWSTEGLTIVHDGCELDTIDKTRWIVQFPMVLETLRPCGGFEAEYNCGRCLKCLRTAIDLYQIGCLEQCPTLPHQIDAARLREVLTCSGGPVHLAAFRRRLETFDAMGGLPEVRQVLAEHLAEPADSSANVEPMPRRGIARWRARLAGTFGV
jgi:hypothetical protein